MSSEGPFEWLAGGLFFGKHAKKRIAGIDSCKDAAVLLKGISQSLDEILSSKHTDKNKDAATDEAPKEGTPTPEMFLAARLRRLRFLLYDERRIPSKDAGRRNNSSPTAVGSTLQGLTGDQKNLIPKLVEHLVSLPFESRKDVAAIFNYLLICGFDGSDAEVYRPLMCLFRDYVKESLEMILGIMVKGLQNTDSGQTDVALHFGSMYRALLKHPILYQGIVGTTDAARLYVFPFLDKIVHVPNFEVASDSMETLREIFTAGAVNNSGDPQIQQELAEASSAFLIRDYDEIWNQRFNPKLLSESANYMTRRIALQILSTVLLTRSNYNVMIQFVASKSNLILVMKLLRDTSPHITLDAFHVFKVFVANPNKPPEVVNILRENKTKLSKYLSTLHQEKENSDTQFRDEKALIIATIEAL